MIGLAIGAGLAWIVAQAMRGGGQPGEAAAGERPACAVAVVFLAPASPAGQVIAAVTGGPSHVVVDACEHDRDGAPLVFDCQPAQGVTRQPWSRYAAREAARIQFGGDAAWYLSGCLTARVGASYGGGMTCASLVAGCLTGYQGPAHPTPAELLEALQ